MEKKFGELSQFLDTKRNVELFRSSDLHNTAIYFTDVEDDKREDAKAFFELLRFELDGGDHQIYIRFPNENHFVEMLDGGMGSGRGNMTHAGGQNVWEDSNKSPFEVLSHDDNLILLFGRSDWTQEFNFMKKAAQYHKGNKYSTPYPKETFINYEEIEKALSMKFLKIPEDVRKISYMFKTKGETDIKYFVVDYPAYNFQYENQRFRVVENGNVKEYPVKKFDRYRDGGTTYIVITDENGVEHTLFSPQQMFDDGQNLFPKFDDIELIEETKNSDEWNLIIYMLGIELEPVEEEDKSKKHKKPE